MRRRTAERVSGVAGIARRIGRIDRGGRAPRLNAGDRRPRARGWRLRTADGRRRVLPTSSSSAAASSAAPPRSSRRGPASDVVVLDARPRPATLTTPASTGAFRLQFDNAEEIALVREGIELFEAIRGADGTCRLRPRVAAGTATCSARSTEDTLGRQERMVDVQRAAGVEDIELLSGDEARYRFPYLSPSVLQARFGRATGSSIRSASRTATPSRRRAGEAWDGRRAAAPRRSVSASGRRALTLVGGRAVARRLRRMLRSSAQHVVLATGPFLARTAALAGLTLDLRPTRRQKLVMPVVPEVPPDAPMTIHEETAAHWRPWNGGAFLLCTEADTPPTDPTWNVPTARRLRVPPARSRVADWRRPRLAVLARRLGARRAVVPAGRPVRVHARPSAVRRCHVGRAACGSTAATAATGSWASPGGSRLLADLLTGADTAPDVGHPGRLGPTAIRSGPTGRCRSASSTSSDRRRSAGVGRVGRVRAGATGRGETCGGRAGRRARRGRPG